MMRAPALKAIAIQLLSLLLLAASAHLLYAATGTPLTSVPAVLLQGAIAACLSRWARLAPWWLLIQAVFPIAVFVTLSLQLPPIIFLITFLVLLTLYWSTYRTQVPFYPSGPAAWHAVAELLPAKPELRFIDIGSGLGGLVMHLAATRKSGEFLGVEVAPLPWFVSVLRSRFRRSSAQFLRVDYSRLDFSSYDVVFAYLSPAAMEALWKKARSEMRPGSLLLSYEFDIPGEKPQMVRIPVSGGPTLYGWTM